MGGLENSRDNTTALQGLLNLDACDPQAEKVCSLFNLLLRAGLNTLPAAYIVKQLSNEPDLGSCSAIAIVDGKWVVAQGVAMYCAASGEQSEFSRPHDPPMITTYLNLAAIL